MALSPCKHPPLPNKPGTNYIEQTGGLPHFIDCVARAIFHTGRSHGDVSTAVKIAIGDSEDWAAGKGNVSASTRAQAIAAVAQLKAQGAASKAKTAAKNLSDCGCGNLDLSQRLDEVIDLAYIEREHPRGKGGKWTHLGAVIDAHPNVDIAANENQHGVKISMLRTSGQARGGGHASRALRDILDYADQKGKTVALTPEPVQRPGDTKGLSKAALTAWYRKHGFVPNKGRNKDYAFTESMVRKPGPRRINSPAMNLTSELEQRVIDLTERLTA